MTTNDASGVVLTARNLNIEYHGQVVKHAVRDVDLSIARGEIFGLAGESGCGKSTLAYGLNRLLRPPAVISSGTVNFHDADGETIDVLNLEDEALRRYRWAKVSMVFQGSMNSLNPVISVWKQLEDVYTTHAPSMSRDERRDAAAKLLERVGVDPSRLDSYAHQLSGGMKQRVMIAMALALQPQLIIMDEPTTALDVVVQRDILNELLRLRAESDFAVIFITHDLPLLLEISDRIAIMRDGAFVEEGAAADIYTNPQNAYTQKLLASFPSLTGQRGDFVRHGNRGEATR